MALGWDFFLAAVQSAVSDFISSENIPAQNYFLSHPDPDSNETIFFSSIFKIRDSVAPIPEPDKMIE